MPVEIVEAHDPGRLPLVREMFREYADSLGYSLCFQGFEEELRTLPGRYAPPRGRLLLALDGAEAVGCVALRELRDGVCEMKRMYVRPASRGRGIARQLAQHLISEARGAGYAVMKLDTGPEMHAAQALYRSLGFVETRRYNNDHMEGTLWMELRLSGGVG